MEEYNSQELFDLIVLKGKEIAPDKQLDRLHKAMLMECCENVIAGTKKQEHSKEILMYAAISALEVSRTMMKSLIKATIPNFADVITLNYRGETFTLDTTYHLVVEALKN